MTVADGPIDLTQVSEEHERVALLRGDDVAWYTPARTLAAAVRGLAGSARTADNGRSIVWDHPTGVQARYTTDAGWTVTGPGSTDKPIAYIFAVKRAIDEAITLASADGAP